MTLYRTALFNIAAVLFLIPLSNCKTIPTEKIPDSANISDEITTTENDLNDALEQQVDVKAPKSFAQAKEDLADAKSMQTSNKDNEDILAELAKSRAYLKRAVNFAA